MNCPGDIKIRVLPEGFDGSTIANPLLKLAVRVALATGIRISELLSLRIENIADTGGDQFSVKELVQIPDLKKKKSKSRNPLRSIYLPKYLREEILQYIITEGHRTEGPLFEAVDGRKLAIHRSHLLRLWKEWQASQAWPQPYYRWHDLRHTCATRALDAGFSLSDVQMMLGHKNIATTSVYLHTNINQLAAKIEKVLEKKNEEEK